MDIIAPVFPLQYGCAAKEALTHHLMTLMMLAISISVICRVTLMYLSTLTSFPQSSLSVLLTRLHRKSMDIFIYLLALDVTNSSCSTMWWNDVSHSYSSSIRLSSGLTWNRWLAVRLFLIPVMTSGKFSSNPLRYSTTVNQISPGVCKSSAMLRYLCTFPIVILRSPKIPYIHYMKLFTSLGYTCDTFRSSTSHKNVLCLPQIILFAT